MTTTQKAMVFDHLVEMMTAGYALSLSSGLKRLTIDGQRDFYPRFSYEARRHDNLVESRWEGYETPEETLLSMAMQKN